MIAELMIALAMVVPEGCPQPKILNLTRTAWDIKDQNVLQSLVDNNRCKHHFRGSICVVSITKEKQEPLQSRQYHVTCGAKNEN